MVCFFVCFVKERQYIFINPLNKSGINTYLENQVHTTTTIKKAKSKIGFVAVFSIVSGRSMLVDMIILL